MDLWTLRVKNTHRSPFLLRNSILEKPSSWNSRKMRAEDARIFEIRVSRRYVSGYQSLVARARGKKNPENSDFSSSFGNGDQSVPEEGGAKGNNSSSESNKSSETASQKSHGRTLDWREFRAALFAGEQAETAGTGSRNQDGDKLEPKPLGLRWAHPISAPEDGCILVATEKLDGVRTFERTVVLLLRSGTSHPQEGPFGVVINRPLNKRIKHMKPTNLDLATTFADCSLHFGGPLEASMFLMKTGEKSQLPGFEGVIPGLCYGARNSLDEASELVKKGVLKPQDFKFYVGYAGWQLDQLREEIESDYWYVAACSANLIFGGSTNSSSSEGLWEEILQLMGGHYSELSRKPKQDM
ncbi:uncharacterized protein LOC130786765 [Actinidia eriantha]|uniref:uncharacterized protein LOC130786765 n=1 Tax=Actinidia eriantha TaxID=165200 RepID=UPI00258CC1A4|nr:uncharacterized protein LOC130786765 [Actinidia eriantha]